MTTPPILIKLRIAEKNKRKFALWLPVVLLWLPLLLLYILIIPFYIITFFVLIWTRKGRRMLYIPFAFHNLLCALRGLRIIVNDEEDKVNILII